MPDEDGDEKSSLSWQVSMVYQWQFLMLVQRFAILQDYCLAQGGLAMCTILVSYLSDYLVASIDGFVEVRC